MTTPKVLIVDDDPEVTSAIGRGLQRLGYAVTEEQQLSHALQRLREERFSAAVIDVMLGPDSGLALVRQLRKDGNKTPVIMLSALSTAADRAEGLDAGADDYVVKPFSFEELAARLNVQERRARSRRVTLEHAGRCLRSPDHEVTLTEREFALLALLVDNPGRPLSRAEIFDRLWAREGASAENVVDVYIGTLRRKLGTVTDLGFTIQTIRNRGFQVQGTLPTIL